MLGGLKYPLLMRIVSFEIMYSMASKDLLESVLHLAFHKNSWPYLISQYALPITTGTWCGHSMFPAKFLQCFCIPASFPSLPPSQKPWRLRVRKREKESRTRLSQYYIASVSLQHSRWPKLGFLLFVCSPVIHSAQLILLPVAECSSRCHSSNRPVDPRLLPSSSSGRVYNSFSLYYQNRIRLAYISYSVITLTLATIVFLQV